MPLQPGLPLGVHEKPYDEDNITHDNVHFCCYNEWR